MNNTTIINIFNSDNSNIAYIKTLHCQTIAYIILKFESMIKRKINGKSYIFNFWQDQLCLRQFYCNTAFVISNLEKGFHQDNLSFSCLKFYKHNCLNVLAGQISFYTQVKNQLK